MGGGPGPSRAELRRLSQLSKGGAYGMSMGYNPRYLIRGGTSRHPHNYSLQWDSHKCLHITSLLLYLYLVFFYLSIYLSIFTFTSLFNTPTIVFFPFFFLNLGQLAKLNTEKKSREEIHTRNYNSEKNWSPVVIPRHIKTYQEKKA